MNGSYYECKGFDQKTIIGMSRRVMEKLTAKHENIRKEMRTTMVGRVLDYEAKRILDQGMERGMKQGAINMLVTLTQKGLLSVKNAAEEAGMSEETFRQKMG